MFSAFANSIRLGLLALLVAAPLPYRSAESATAKGGALAARKSDGRKQFTLTADATWLLDTKERFDASALAFYNSKLITVNDQKGEFFEIQLTTNSVAPLKRFNLFPKATLAEAAPKRANRYDLEGIAVDPYGDIYVSEESQRLVFRMHGKTRNIEALTFDWAPVSKFFSGGLNASFEGIALGGNRLYLANERSAPQIVVIDLASRKVIDSFWVDSENFAFGGPHYSDLSFFEGHLFILDRNHRCIFQVEPESKRVVAEYSFAKMELAEEVAYKNDYPTGAMEGLAIEKDYFWLVTDNNGKTRFKAPRDNRPTLFRCPRPQVSSAR
jgi:uncharacterized protein YjiK